MKIKVKTDVNIHVFPRDDFREDFILHKTAQNLFYIDLVWLVIGVS